MTLQGGACVIDCWNRIGVTGDRSCPELETYDHCRNCPVFSSAGRSLLDRPTSIESLRENSLSIEMAPPRGRARVQSFVLFRLGYERLAMPTAAFEQIYEPQSIHRVPHCKSRILLGLVNLGGDLHLCVSLSKLFGLQQGEEAGFQQGRTVYPRLAVIGDGEGRWAFPTDEIYGVHRCNLERIKPPPATVSKSTAPYISGVLDWYGDRAGVIDEQRLFNDLKRSVF